MRSDLATKGDSPPLLSILLPVYNVAPYLEECVQSIISQVDRDDIEIILLDDASTDGSYALCQSLCQQHGSLLKLLQHTKNRGLSAARNSLLDASTGTYIWFIDSDDVMLPSALKDLCAILDNASPDMILCDYEQNGRHFRCFTGKAESLETDTEKLIAGVFEARKLHAWSKISRRSLWEKSHQFPEGKCFEDIATTPWLLLNAQSYYYVPKPWIYYRVRAGSIISMVSHKSAAFDDRKNDDLAQAMHGFPEYFQSRLPGASLETRFLISHFLAKEYTKIVHRLIKCLWNHDHVAVILMKMNRYNLMMQEGSPMPFREVAREYYKRGKIVRWLVTLLCLYLGSLRGTQKRLPK